jgi:eukaryotic-like serine/threonine-protein kinase
VPTFRMDRTEVTNAAFATFAAMAELTNVHEPHYPIHSIERGASEPRKPVSGVDWFAAHAFCRFLGKQLPTTEQWQKALRGALELGGRANPYPRRNLPWGRLERIPRVNIRLDAKADEGAAADVGTHLDDISPYGVLDLAGNVMEWTDSSPVPGVRIVRGGNWSDVVGISDLADFDAIQNERSETHQWFTLGFRCVDGQASKARNVAGALTGNTIPGR